MDMTPPSVRCASLLAVTCSTGPTAASPLDWSKITGGSNSETQPCAAWEASLQPHASAVPSMKCASAFDSVPQGSKKEEHSFLIAVPYFVLSTIK